MVAPDRKRRLRLGMVGGGRDAFIGAVHRSAARLDARYDLVAGALSSTPERSIESGRDLGLVDNRNYPTWEAMIESERALPEGERVDVISIVTPNHMHYPIAKACIEAGIHVICDKPMVMKADEAESLERCVAAHDVVFCVTYNYTGYPMIKHARHLVTSGAIGTVRKVIVEYNQGWLATRLEDTGQKQADWRTDPTRAGAGGAIGDIGSHAENLSTYVTGMAIAELCADLTSFLGRDVDDDANLLLRYPNGARGLMTASQVCVGKLNDLRLRVWGSEGGIEWRQEDPNHLIVHEPSGSDRILHRGDAGLCEAAQRNTRLPVGHPEAFIEAFGNIYTAAADAITNGVHDGTAGDFPDVHAGTRGVRFIEAAVASSAQGQQWTELDSPGA